MVRSLLDGHQINAEHIPPEVSEFAVLETLGGYTLARLEAEQNLTVNRWMTIVAERSAKERHKAEEARRRADARR